MAATLHRPASPAAGHVTSKVVQIDGGAERGRWDAAGRAARPADPAALVSTKDKVLTAGDYLTAYVLEWTLHHLDLVAHLPSAPRPPARTLAAARAALERIAGAPFPAELSDTDALLVGTGRRTSTAGETSALGGPDARLPLVLG